MQEIPKVYTSYNHKVLLIEDNELTVKLLKHFFEDFNFNFYSSNNAIRGLKIAEEIKPNVILCDINLPYKNGINFLRDKNEKASIKEIPTIMLTVEKSIEAIKTAVKLGAVDYLVKPFDLIDLLTRIETALDIENSIHSAINDTRKTQINYSYDEGVILLDISGPLNIIELKLIKYKLLELVEIFNMSILKILITVKNLKKETLSSEGINQLLTISLEKDYLKKQKIVIYSTNKDFHVLFNKSSFANVVKITDNYFEALKILNYKSDFYKEYKINLIKDNSAFPYDLVDKNCNTIIEAYNKLTPELKDTLKQNGFKKLYLQMFKSKNSLKNQTETILSMNKDTKNFNRKINYNFNNTILIIEDTKLLTQQLAKFFKKLGITTHIALNGEEGLQKLKKNKIDLIILDLLLEGMNGINFLKIFKKMGYDIPIIVVSGLFGNKASQELQDYPVNGFLSKPFKLENLVDLLTDFLTPIKPAN